MHVSVAHVCAQVESPVFAPMSSAAWRCAGSSRRGFALSGLEIKMTFCRRAMYYVSNVALIMCIICTFVLTAWASDDVADRQATLAPSYLYFRAATAAPRRLTLLS